MVAMGGRRSARAAAVTIGIAGVLDRIYAPTYPEGT